LLAVNHHSNNITVFVGHGGGAFAAPRLIGVGSRPLGLEIADLNRDGKPDYVAANSESNDLSVILGGGIENLSAVRYAVGKYPAAVKIGDIDNDGFLDLLTVNKNIAAPGVSILSGNGDGTFRPARNIAVGEFPSDAAIGDFDADGLKDLAVADVNYSSVLLLHGKADGTFRAPVNYGVGVAPAALLTADFDRNGAPDLATSNFGSGTVSVLLNLCRVRQRQNNRNKSK
jgi:hypothetical protein